jgi:predicted GIY-YIG superfamily endonuclease
MKNKKDKKACENEEKMKNVIKKWKMKINNEYAF